MVLVKELKIFHLFILGKNGKNKFFCDFLVRKNALLDYKNKEFKMAKNWHFCEGVSYSLCHKIDNFPSVYFKQN